MSAQKQNAKKDENMTFMNNNHNRLSLLVSSFISVFKFFFLKGVFQCSNERKLCFVMVNQIDLT